MKALLQRFAGLFGVLGTPGRGKRPLALRRYQCRCGHPIFFGNSRCLACGRELGFEPGALTMLALEAGQTRWQRCANAALCGCNWLVAPDEAPRHEGLCRACRLNRTIPDLDEGDNALLWSRIEVAKRRLVSQLLALGLPVRSRVTEDTERGVMFDFLKRAPGGPPVSTGHAGGLITLDLDEADDATRARLRDALAEPYRTLLGHLRHEIGHYYWQRLVAADGAGTGAGEAAGGWLQPFRVRFGDERVNYAEALERHYREGPPADWAGRCVSAYAASHPWEDWAETFAHYLHMVDTLDTALSFGLEAEEVETGFSPYGAEALDAPGDPEAERFLGFVNAWLPISALMNELARSMGQPDFYPFVLSAPAVAKLHLVHRIVAHEAAHLAATHQAAAHQAAGPPAREAARRAAGPPAK
ncbi:MAG: putative zinc-binding metallopeptidase [Burkholderiales bacterium]|nr:putative zinc-binding metallopeptidase [Burkholderiales bacterium]